MRLVLFIFVIMGFLFYDNGFWVLLGVVCFSFVFGQCAWGAFVFRLLQAMLIGVWTFENWAMENLHKNFVFYWSVWLIISVNLELYASICDSLWIHFYTLYKFLLHFSLALQLVLQAKWAFHFPKQPCSFIPVHRYFIAWTSLYFSLWKQFTTLSFVLYWHWYYFCYNTYHSRYAMFLYFHLHYRVYEWLVRGLCPSLFLVLSPTYLLSLNPPFNAAVFNDSIITFR